MLGQHVASNLNEAEPSSIANTVLDVVPGELWVFFARLDKLCKFVDEKRRAKVCGRCHKAKTTEQEDLKAERGENRSEKCVFTAGLLRVILKVHSEPSEIVLHFVFLSQLSIHADM